jgi:hypothetical protein
MLIGLVFVLIDVAVSSMSILANLLFIVSFALGWGGTLWIYLSEIYPAELRGGCISGAILLNWVASAIVVFGVGEEDKQKILLISIWRSFLKFEILL